MKLITKYVKNTVVKIIQILTGTVYLYKSYFKKLHPAYEYNVVYFILFQFTHFLIVRVIIIIISYLYIIYLTKNYVKIQSGKIFTLFIESSIF